MEIRYESWVRRKKRWRKKFALLPVRIDNSRLLWLEPYWVRLNPDHLDIRSPLYPWERTVMNPHKRAVL